MPTERLYGNSTPRSRFAVLVSYLASPTAQDGSRLLTPRAYVSIRLGGSRLSLSSTYRFQQSWSCRRLLMQAALWAFALAFDKTGKSIEARIEMMAMTTSSSIKVKPSASVEGLNR